MRDRFLVDVAMEQIGVVDAVRAQQCFVAGKKRAAGRLPVVPDQRGPAAVAQNAPHFDRGARHIEPVKRLARNHKVDCVVGQRGRFGSAGDAAIRRKLAQLLIARRTHRRVRLDAITA